MANMQKTVKGRLKLKMRQKIEKKRKYIIVTRLNEILADPSSEEESDCYSEDEEKAQKQPAKCVNLGLHQDAIPRIRHRHPAQKRTQRQR